MVDIKDDTEITDLQTAIDKVLDKIRWHEESILKLTGEIQDHEKQIVQLKTSFKSKIGSLIDPNHEFESTGHMIQMILKSAGKPLNIEQIKNELKKNGKSVDPSVELSRMAKRGQISRVNRGFYEIKHT